MHEMSVHPVEEQEKRRSSLVGRLLKKGRQRSASVDVTSLPSASSKEINGQAEGQAHRASQPKQKRSISTLYAEGRLELFRGDPLVTLYNDIVITAIAPMKTLPTPTARAPKRQSFTVQSEVDIPAVTQVPPPPKPRRSWIKELHRSFRSLAIGGSGSNASSPLLQGKKRSSSRSTFFSPAAAAGNLEEHSRSLMGIHSNKKETMGAARPNRTTPNHRHHHPNQFYGYKLKREESPTNAVLMGKSLQTLSENHWDEMASLNDASIRRSMGNRSILGQHQRRKESNGAQTTASDLHINRLPYSSWASQSSRSHSHSHSYSRSNSQTQEALATLHSQIKETKYVTAVFESRRGGLAPILGDVVDELAHWLGSDSQLLAVACEVRWAVPERYRSRAMEIRMKDCLHRALRDNNRRVLRLYDEWAVRALPESLIESKTEESCNRIAKLDLFQGTYRRYYPDLLALQDPTTVQTHKPYWSIDNLLRGEGNGDRKDSTISSVHSTASLLGGQDEGEEDQLLRGKSVVTLNMATLKLEGDHKDYDAGCENS